MGKGRVVRVEQGYGLLLWGKDKNRIDRVKQV